MAIPSLLGRPLHVPATTRRRPVLAVVVGVLLIGWIVVQVLFLRELSFFHPFYLAVGIGFVAAGRRPIRAG